MRRVSLGDQGMLMGGLSLERVPLDITGRRALLQLTHGPLTPRSWGWKVLGGGL